MGGDYLGLDVLGLVLVVVGLAAEAELLEQGFLRVLVYITKLLLLEFLVGERLRSRGSQTTFEVLSLSWEPQVY